MIKIIVSTEQEKQELLESSKAIDEILDTESLVLPGTNILAKLHLAEHLIKVERSVVVVRNSDYTVKVQNKRPKDIPNICFAR